MVEWVSDIMGDCMVKIGKDQAESIVSSDLKKRYPDIKYLEFIGVRFSEVLGEWTLMGWFSTESGLTRVFLYSLNAETGQVKEYIITSMR
jgi:hypothetical protein